MLNILVVDDEPVVRRGLKTIIRWQDYNCSICGEASNGMEGLQKIEEYPPDIVMVDIKMPEMDGLTFIEKAKQKGYECKFMILSGYDDFNFAQKAIKLGVNAYLLKPIEENELIELLLRFQKEIDEDKKRKNVISDGVKYVVNETIKTLMNSKDFDEILNDNYRNCISGYEIFTEFNVAIVKILNATNKSGIDMLNNFLKHEKNVEIYDVNGDIIILFCDSSKKTIDRILYTVNRGLENQFSKKVFIVLGEKVETIKKISFSYEAAKRIIDKQFFYEHLGIVYSEKLSEEQRDDEVSVGSIEYGDAIEKIYISIEMNDVDGVKKIIQDIALIFKRSSSSSERVKGIYANIVLEVLKRIESVYSEIKGAYSHNTIMHAIYEMHNMMEVMNYIVMFADELSQKISSISSDTVIRRIIDYVNRNYDKDLKVETLAYRFNYSNAYLGQMFKNYTGEYFNSYVDRLRIENAKNLLLKGYKASEVAQKVGFKNKDYFYNKFKKYVGIGPSEYKKTYTGN
ncbi:response regulator transcription factor [Clostridium oryzae]|uniref:Stage 0 sporulation protein A homolog n=1 Tax=Clostridium oryzae TaxID=1450648 RepID=A0A1V4IUN9_9CLOT|nr:response regulator [Clostridium oryzae]OPJ63540.1 putative response regulatory protein [Clostridium oryzae]